MFYAVIMAGGSGTRLWPLSRDARPKQTLRLVGDRTLFQHAVDRLAPLFPPERILVVAGAAHTQALAEQAPEIPAENWIVEPEGRGTAPAIGLAAIHLQRRDPEAVMAVLTADHYIRETKVFRTALAGAEQSARQGYLVTLGIRPNEPATGFGYIHQGDWLGEPAGLSVYRLARFVEKPSLQAAQLMVGSGEYCWNSGMFIWQVERILAEIDRQMPELAARLNELKAVIGTAEYEPVLAYLWPRIPKQTIDYGVMEGARQAAVIPVEIGWTDVGSWDSLSDLLPADSDGNVTTGPYIGRDTHRTITFSRDRLIATLGVEDLVIIDSEDAILICARGREQEVRAIVEELRKQGRTDWL